MSKQYEVAKYPRRGLRQIYFYITIEEANVLFREARKRNTTVSYLMRDRAREYINEIKIRQLIPKTKKHIPRDELLPENDPDNHIAEATTRRPANWEERPYK